MNANLPIDEETMRLAERVAQIKGQPLDVMVRQAIEASARASGAAAPERKRIDMGRVRSILARIDALPVLDDRSADEIIGFDDYGLPR